MLNLFCIANGSGSSPDPNIYYRTLFYALFNLRKLLYIIKLSGGTAQSGRSHCSIQAEPLLNFAGRGDFAQPAYAA